MYEPSIKKLWGIAKSKELSMSDDDLHEFVYGQTGKSSIKKLTRRELSLVITALGNLKDMAGGKRKPGNPVTEEQRKKLYILSRRLGWKDNRRINGMAKRMFKIDRVEWLDYIQCSKLIEALKAMLKREGEKE